MGSKISKMLSELTSEDIKKCDVDPSLEGRDEDLHVILGIDKNHKAFIIHILNQEKYNPYILDYVEEDFDCNNDYILEPGVYDVWLGVNSWQEFNGEHTEWESEINFYKQVKLLTCEGSDCSTINL